MLSCTVITRDNVKTRRFLVVDVFQLILVDPSNKRMGWGVVKFVGFLQVRIRISKRMYLLEQRKIKKMQDGEIKLERNITYFILHSSEKMMI